MRITSFFEAYLKYANKCKDRGFELLQMMAQMLFSKSLNYVTRPTIYSTRFFCKMNPLRTDADPFKIIWVNPDEITRAIRTTPHAWGKVQSGDWDKNTFPFEERPPNKAIKNWIKEGDRELLKTSLTSSNSSTAEPRYLEGGTSDRMRELEELRDSLIKHGYKSKRDLYFEESNGFNHKSNDPVHPLVDEIIVDIDRNGNFIHRYCGQHRLRLAQLLNIDTVAVLVARRHRNWQNIRKKVSQSERISTNISSDHPDLQDIT